MFDMVSSGPEGAISNFPYDTRKKMFQKSKSNTLCFQVESPLLLQQRILPNNVSVQLVSADLQKKFQKIIQKIL